MDTVKKLSGPVRDPAGQIQKLFLGQNLVDLA